VSDDAALIEQPEGSPGAVAEAGTSLQRVAGGFERGGGVVARASSSVSAWEGRASVSFDGRVAGYGVTLVAVEQVLQSARGAVRRYETALEDARAKIRQLREQEEMAVARLTRAKRQLEDAQGRLGEAQGRMTAVSAGAGLLEPVSLSAQAQAGRDGDNAQADIDAAQKQIDREREEIRESRADAKREETQLIEVEDNAAAAVRAAAARLPHVQLPGGAASPSAYAGTPFGGLISPLASDPRWASAMNKAAEDDEPEEPGFFAKAWDHTMENFGAGTPLEIPLRAADAAFPGFREDFGRGLVEDTAVGVKDLAVMGVTLSPAYRLIDSEGQDRQVQALKDTANFAYHEPGEFLKQASGVNHAEEGHPGRMIGGWVPALIPVGGAALRGSSTLSRTTRVAPDADPPMRRSNLNVPESPPYRRDALPELTGTEREAFSGGEYTVRELQAGSRFYRAEGAASEHPGRWLGQEPALTKGGAENLYNVKKWDNPLEVMREYRLRHDLTLYEGGVEGGTGRQSLVPPDIPREHLDELLQRTGDWRLP